MSDKDTPVITIDGPTASGKGTVSQLLATHLGFHYLDSGALYRLTALAVQRRKMDEQDQENIAWVARLLDCRFSGVDIFLDDENVSHTIRQESIGNLASRIATFPSVRSALTDLQQSFRKPPGLVADGRDMGTHIFPDAFLKVYMTASVEARADRRYKQLMEKGFSASISDLRRDIAERDQRDMQRDVAPLRPARDALTLDTTDMSIAATVECILTWYEEKRSGVTFQPT